MRVNLENEWHKYIEFIMKSRNSLSPVSMQYREMKRVFYASCEIMLNVLVDQIGPLPEDIGFEEINKVYEQIKKFWDNENTQFGGKAK